MVIIPMYALILCGSLFLPSLAHATDPGVPEGWRPLALSELKGTTDYDYRSPEKDFLHVVEDFDGDGRKDAARFLVRNDGKEYALFITRSQGNALVHHKHFSVKTLTEIARLGIDTAPPGEYSTACGKGYWECSAQEPPEITLHRPGIDSIQFDAATALIFWDDKQQKFEQIPTTD